MEHKGGGLVRFIKTSGLFLIGTALSKLVLVFLLPYYTANLGQDEMGYYDLSVAIVTVAASALFFDIWITTMRFMYIKEDTAHRESAMLSGFTLFGASTVLYLVAAVIVALAFSIRFFWLIVLFGLLQNLMNMYAYAARGYGRNVDFAISGILCSAVLAGSNILMISVWGMDFSSLYIAGALGYIAQMIYLEIRVKVLRRMKICLFDRAQIRAMMRYTLPLSLNAVAFWMVNSFNKVVVARSLSIADNGIFSVSEKLAALISFAVICFTNAWQDLSFSQKDNEEERGAYYSDACRVYLCFLAMCVVLLLPVIKLLFPVLVDSSYADASLIIPLAVATAAISGYALFLGNIFYAINDTKTLLWTSLISCAVNLTICWSLIGRLGLQGANLSMFLSFAVGILVRNMVLRRKIGFRAYGLLTLAAITWIAAGSFFYYRFSLEINLIWFAGCLVGFAALALRELRRLYPGFLQRPQAGRKE